MTIPKSVKIGGHVLAVKHTNNCEDISDCEIGRTVLAKNVILLNENYPQSRQEEAFLHEVIHNCLYDIDHNQEQDEALVERLGTVLYMIVVDNPKIFESSNQPDERLVT